MLATHRAPAPRTRAQEKDPDLESIIGLITSSGLSLDQIVENAERGGYSIARSTLISWLYGRVSRPQHYTYVAAMTGLGYVQQWVRRQ